MMKYLNALYFLIIKTFIEGKDLGGEVFLLTKGPNGTFELVSNDTFDACYKYTDFVVNACELDLSKVSVNTLDCDNVQLDQLIHIVDI